MPHGPGSRSTRDLQRVKARRLVQLATCVPQPASRPPLALDRRHVGADLRNVSHEWPRRNEVHPRRNRTVVVLAVCAGVRTTADLRPRPSRDEGALREVPHGAPDRSVLHPSADFLLDVLIREVRARQSLVRAVLEDEEEADPLPFIGSMTMDDGVAGVVASIRQTVQITLHEFRAQRTAYDAFKLLRERVEQTGIFVLLIGNLGSYHTAIDLETFRGFALADEVTPFVVMNDQDAKAAWSFTLIHETAHLWLGQTGISGAYADLAVEQFCNDVAGEYLLPANELANFPMIEQRDTDALVASINEFANERNVSRSMVAYKLYRGGLLEHAIWRRLSARFRREWLDDRAEGRREARAQDGGPNYYVIRRHRVGSALIGLVSRMLSAGALTTTKAGKVLGVKAKNVQTMIGPDATGPTA